MAEYIDRERLKKVFDKNVVSAGVFNDIIDAQPLANVIERSKIDKAKTNIEIMLEQEKQKDGTYTDVGKGIAIALGLINNEIGERKNGRKTKR